MSKGLQEVNKAPVSFKESKKIRSALASNLLEYSPEAGEAGVKDANDEILRHSPAVLEAVRHVVSADMQRDIGRDFMFSAEDLSGDGDICITSDLADRLGITAQKEHELVERAILAVAGMDQRIRLMESFEAVTGFRQSDMPVFQQKLSFLMSQLDPDIYESNLERVITIGNLPGFADLPPDPTIDAKKILQLRSDAGCHELRAWLRNIDSETDEEINDRFNGLRENMSWLAGGRTGRRHDLRKVWAEPA
ncbi:MAG TPA: hypothetical protein VMI73_01290 [Trebonia sp.]|nr:hypothetical protein [Trebonia sp.]